MQTDIVKNFNKLKQVAEFFAKLGIRSVSDADEVGSVKLMKLVYLFHIEYIEARWKGIVPDGGIPQDDPFSNYCFYAYPYGPVEKFVYNNIGLAKSLIKDFVNEEPGIWTSFSGAQEDYLTEALRQVKKKYLSMTTSEIVAFTHHCLYKWQRTRENEEMEFAPEDYKYECSIISSYDSPERLRNKVEMLVSF